MLSPDYTGILRCADIPVEYHDFPGMRRRPAIRAFNRKTERQPNYIADGTLPTPVSSFMTFATDS